MSDQSQTSPQAVKPINVQRALFKNLVMGGTAGIIGATCTYPLDMVKTRMQNQKFGERLYKNSFDCAAKIVSREGVRGLYRGLPTQLVGIAPEKAIKLTVNDGLRYAFTDKRTGDLGIGYQLLAGAVAGLSQVVVTNPYELVKVRLQTQALGHTRKGPFAIVGELGLRGLFTGAGACLLRDIPFSAMYFTTYGTFKKWSTDEHGHLPTPLLFASGIGAGVISAALATPADVIKTRLQVVQASGTAYTGIANCFTRIVQEEGAAALFKGVGPRVLIISPLFGITLMCYELLKDFFKDF